MSFCVNAALFNNQNNQNNEMITDTPYTSKGLSQGVTNKRRTIKKKDNNNTTISEKIKDIWNSVDEDSDDENNNYEQPTSNTNFSPPPPPKLSELNQKPLEQDNSNNENHRYLEKSEENNNSDNSDNSVNVETFNNISEMPDLANEQFYKQYVPYYNNTTNQSLNRDELMEKMNKVIQLLEDQQDEKSNNVTEELVLYCFLGVFVIFIVDSFARAGKYTR